MSAPQIVRATVKGVPDQIVILDQSDGLYLHRSFDWVEGDRWHLDANVTDRVPLALYPPATHVALGEDDAERFSHALYNSPTKNIAGAIRALLAGQNKPQRQPVTVEPTDPAVRLVDKTDISWARVDDWWCNRYGGRMPFDDLATRGPLYVVEPEEPTDETH